MVRKVLAVVLLVGGKRAVMADAMPEVSPATIQEMTARVRGSWKADAIPVQADVQWLERLGYRVRCDFYSARARAGYTLTRVANTETSVSSSNPQGWNTNALPSRFLPLSEAWKRASGNGSSLDRALLMMHGSSPAAGLVWSITARNSNSDAIELAAYVMTPQELEQLTAAANRGDSQAQLDLAIAYARGTAGHLEMGRALEWLSKAAEKGNPRAQNKLGQFYQYGTGVPANFARAVEWYRKSALQGFAPGQFNLGLMYERGLGVARNYATARQWIAAAAKQGLGSAISELPRVNAAANGRSQSPARSQQAGNCPNGYFRTPTGCKSIGVIMTQPH